MQKTEGIATDAPKGGSTYGDFEIVDDQGDIELQTLFTGVCGTDRGMVAGHLQFAYNPKGQSNIILGHEALGKVIDPGSSTSLRKGDLVVPVVRRPGDCVNCRIGRQDNCSDGEKHEAGITGKNGFMRRTFYDSEEFLVKVPDLSMKDYAVLTEPTKNVMKALEVFGIVSKRSVFAAGDSTYRGKKCTVIGTGPEAFLYAMSFSDLGFTTHITNRHPVDDNRLKICDYFNLGFVDYSTDMGTFDQGIDVVVDTSGDPGTIFTFYRKLNNNGIMLLFGTNGKAQPTSVSGVDIDHMIERNLTILGTVDAAKIHYIQALEKLSQWGNLPNSPLKKLITSLYDPQDETVFTRRNPSEIKAVIRWD
jgi:glucose/galactose 1-dehydrogenase (NADP+)/aldose 1-dehydrogenase [NAD(P)+]